MVKKKAEEGSKTDEGGTPKFNSEDIERGARDIVDIERQCFYGDDSQHNRLKKIRGKLNSIINS